MQLFAAIDEEYVTRTGLFVTLTYPNEWPGDWAVWKDDLRRMLQKIERACPECSIIWRLELQKRGAPHYHLLILGTTWLDEAWLTRAWGEIAHTQDQYHGRYATRVERPANYTQTASYVAKYCAKADGGERPAECGRVWGVRQAAHLPITLIEAELTRDDAQLLKEGILACIPAQRHSWWMDHGRGGAWTMIDGVAALKMAVESSAYTLDWHGVAMDLPSE